MIWKIVDYVGTVLLAMIFEICLPAKGSHGYGQ